MDGPRVTDTMHYSYYNRSQGLSLDAVAALNLCCCSKGSLR